MKLRYKLLILLILFFVFLLFKTDVFATSYNLSSVLSSKDKYVIYTSNDNKIYLLKSASSNIFGNYYDLSYVSDNGHFLSSKGNSSSAFMDASLYVLENSTCSYVTNLNWQKIEGECLNLYNVKDVLYCYSDIKIIDTDTIYVNSNSITDFSNVEINSSTFKPVLEKLNFVRTIDGHFIATDVLDFDYYEDYYFELYNENTSTFERVNTLKNYEDRYYVGENGNNVLTIGVRYYFPVSELGVYTLRLHKENSDLVSNSVSFTITDFNVAIDVGILNYDIPAPYFDYGFSGNKAIVYTQYLDLKYYDNINLIYYNNKNTGTSFDWSSFPSYVISKEYNFDKTQFRFKLEFEEACSYSVRFCFIIKDSYSSQSVYYSDTSTFNITQEYFDTEGYGSEQGFLSRIGNWLKNFFVGLFVPSSNYLDTKINDLGDKLNAKIPYKQYIEDFEQLSDIEHENRDITVSADLAEYKISDNLTIDKPKFIDFSFLSKYQDVWFSWVRVVTYIGLIIFNINMLMKYLRGINLSDGFYKEVISSSNSNSKK